MFPTLKELPAGRQSWTFTELGDSHDTIRLSVEYLVERPAEKAGKRDVVHAGPTRVASYA